jgi:zinc/manganese transport system permease protein
MSDLMLVMAAPFVACLLLVAMFAYLGIHIIAREVIFVDLSLAQMASLGSTSALLFGVAPHSALGYAFALGATMLGALIFALTRTGRERRRVPQEAIIGIVFVVASAATILIAERTPTGADLIKETLVGSILWVGWPMIPRMAAVFALVGLFHWFLRRRFFTISLDEDAAARLGWHARWWDFLFYASFGVAITVAVPLAGVLLVFTFLVVPSVIAFLFTRRPAALLAISWTAAAVACAAGLLLSFELDLPTGPLIILVFAVVLAAAAVASRWTPTPGTP